LFVINVVTGKKFSIAPPLIVNRAKWNPSRFKVAFKPNPITLVAPEVSESGFEMDSEYEVDSESEMDSEYEVDGESEMDSVYAEGSDFDSQFSGESYAESNESPTQPTNDADVFEYPTFGKSSSPCKGIRAMVCNPKKTFMAIAVGYLQDQNYDSSVCFYSLPDLQPLFTASHMHYDAVFQLLFASDNRLVTASRDGMTVMWNIDWENQTLQETVNDEPDDKSAKIRDMVLMPQQIATLVTGPCGQVRLYDMNLNCQGGIQVQHSCELTALAHSSGNILAAGARSMITLMDPRMQGSFASFRSLDDGYGVRSLAFGSPTQMGDTQLGDAETMLTIGGGHSKLSFYDVRNRGYLSWNDECDNASVGNPGKSWVQMDSAVYGLKYNGCRLLAFGGPLQTDSIGSFASLFM
jgi:WD40 repeat protein